MSTNATAGKGTIFRRWDADASSSAGAWENIGEIKSISGPGKSRETIDVTDLGNSTGYRDFIASFKDSGTVELSMLFTRDGYDLMNEDFEADDLVYYEILLPDSDGTSFEFSGLVTELPLEIPLDDVITMDVSIKVSGQVTINSGSATTDPAA